jgi:hypothetical protein
MKTLAKIAGKLETKVQHKFIIARNYRIMKMIREH